MGRQYDRSLTLTVGGTTLAQLDGDPDDCLRVRFKILQHTIQTPNAAQIVVSNVSDKTALALGKVGLPVVLSAGYLDSTGILFKAQLTQFINGRESPTDTTFSLYAHDQSTAYNYGVISKAFAKGSTPLDHFNALADVLKPYGVTKGYAPTELLSRLKYPRGVSMGGMVKDYMRTLALSNGCTWSIQNGELQIVPASGYVPGAPFVLNSTTGLIGRPTQTFDGIMARCLINPAINCGKGNLVQINQKDIQQQVQDQSIQGSASNALIPSLAADGRYRVISIETNGDTRGKEWYMDLTCLTADGSGFTPQSALQFLSPQDAATAQANNQKMLKAN